MATKFDFAQKLLHDLRCRKEQMADAQYIGNSHTISRDFAVKSTNLELKHQSKRRLSNVIAKLMGLDELPKNVKRTQETKSQLKDDKAVEIEHKTFDRILLNNQQKPKDIIEDNNQANRKEEHLSKQKMQVNKHKGRQEKATISQTVRNKAPGLLEKQFPVNQTSPGKRNITKTTTGMPQNRNMNQNALPKNLASRTISIQKKPIKVPSVEKKENYFQIKRKGTPQNMERSLGKQSAIFKAKKQTSPDMVKHIRTQGKLSQEKSEEAKQNITKIHKSEVSSNPLSSAQELRGETKESRENDCQKLEAPISNGNESLNEPEKRLKELLVTSQLFLNTIEALFKLNIPISILQANDPNSKNSEFKLKVHCSYEMVKRKARRQKISNHPFAKISIGCIKVRSLDDLIKQLCKGFDVLSRYGSRGSENSHSTAADYLHTILEKDIQNRHPDLNSTWDFGWDMMMFTPQEKDEIIRDVEKNLLNGLLDEITTDLLRITASV